MSIFCVFRFSQFPLAKGRTTTDANSFVLKILPIRRRRVLLLLPTKADDAAEKGTTAEEVVVVVLLYATSFFFFRVVLLFLSLSFVRSLYVSSNRGSTGLFTPYFTNTNGT